MKRIERRGKGNTLITPLHVGTALLCIFAIMNVVEFGAIEARLGVQWKGIHRWKDSNLNEFPGISSRYQLFFDVSDVARGVTIVGPAERYRGDPTISDTVVARLFGLGRIGHLERRKYDPTDLAAIRSHEAQVVKAGAFRRLARVRGGQLENYKFMLLDENPEELVVFLPAKRQILLVDARLVGPVQSDKQ